jgi:uncharacterized protein (DUF362 family)/Pyruvate/2-oxoacid:ferredoxin oxidoreductase delta subunit
VTVKSKVALVSCNTYDDVEVYRTVENGLDPIGGIAAFVKPGEKIILKPNVLLGAAPEKCVCTHPSVLKAVGKLFLEAGAVVSCGDSPGFGSAALNMRIAGLKQAANELGIPVIEFSRGRQITRKEALLVKHFTIADGVLAADGLISLPKLKTHGLTRMTGAVKNQFGCMPGLLKSQHHARLADPYDFAAMLIDLNMIIRPRLFIMDAVMAMEGNGPRSGQPRKLGVLLFSADPVALDAVACKIINLDPAFVPTSQLGEKAGLGNFKDENIEVVGGKIEDFICRDFKAVRKPPEHAASGRARIFIKNRISARPVIGKALCNCCGTCVEYCPVNPKAVDWVKNDKSHPPAHNYDRCIRCYCCQELCPQGAIFIKETVLGRLFFH